MKKFLVAIYIKIKILSRVINLKLFFKVLFKGVNEAHPVYRFFYKRIINDHISVLKDKIIFCDIGANNGYVSKRLLESFPKLEVIAFEPLKSKFTNFEYLKKKYQNFSSRNIALGSKNEEKVFYVYDNDAHSSFVPINQEENTLNLKKVDEYKIKISRLDEEIEYSDKKIFIKIDSQGYEKKILQGSEGLLKKNAIIAIIIELQIRNIEGVDDFSDFIEIPENL